MCCDTGLLAGRVTRNQYGTPVLDGEMTPWGAVEDARMRVDAWLADETGPYTLTVTIEHPEFTATWSSDQQAPTQLQVRRDELAKFGAEVLRRHGQSV